MKQNNRIEVSRAAIEEQPILANLLELYAHDFSQFYEVELGPDGRFGYGPLPLYWTEPARHAFLVRIGGRLAGFALVKQSDAVYDMAEFFISRRYRRTGAGTEVARTVWNMFPGLWEVRVMSANVKGYEFWKRAIAAYTGEPAASVDQERAGRHWHVFRFESKLD